MDQEARTTTEQPADESPSQPELRETVIEQDHLDVYWMQEEGPTPTASDSDEFDVVVLGKVVGKVDHRARDAAHAMHSRSQDRYPRPVRRGPPSVAGSRDASEVGRHNSADACRHVLASSLGAQEELRQNGEAMTTAHALTITPTTVVRMSTDRPRSLADDLRAREDAALARLLRVRPDLLNPVPSDVAALAARATSRPSVQRALDQLDLFTMQVVEVLCALPDPVAPQRVHDLLGSDPTAALTVLRERALTYGDDTAILVARTVREVVGSPAGLGPPAEQALAGYGPARLERLSADLGLPVAGDPFVAAQQVAEVLADPARLTQLLA